MASFWSGSSLDGSSPGADVTDVADTGVADVGPRTSQPPTSVPMGRPQYQRNQPQPPPPHQPPPPPAGQQVGNSNDSLSLMQLRRIVTEFPRIDPISYAFTYADAASFEEEVDEWFSYNDAEFRRLHRAKDTFERRWKKFSGKGWLDEDGDVQQKFVQREIVGLHATDLRRRCKSLQTLLHVVLGVWDETAGIEAPDAGENGAHEPDNRPGGDTKGQNRTRATCSQVMHIKAGINLVAQAGGVAVLYEVMQNAFKNLWDEEFRETKLTEEDIPFIQDELDNATTIMYLFIESARSDPTALEPARNALLELKPPLVSSMVTVTAKLRWDEANELPQTRIFLLFWKSILLVFGGMDELDKVKKATREPNDLNNDDEKIITASPLDYHIFRQEITSKYPAYTPPPPLLPLEPDNNSILPPLPNRPSRANASNGIIPPSLHIATPAPSPPPSPPVGGKAGKKQNYQTNQNFPFMYPPLDSTSNGAGGKGQAGLQDLLVGRKWEGSDIPKPILEAGELFAGRMRMTRAIRQLWEERERFLKFERGWETKENDDVHEIQLDSLLEHKLNLEESKDQNPEFEDRADDNLDPETKQKLENVEDLYQQSLPHLQSLVIVLLKAVLANVTALLTQPINGQSYTGLAPSFKSEVNLRAQNRPQDTASATSPPNGADPLEISLEETESLRSREITSKAVSGILLMLLKWFKISHILKFEYLTQLLLDSNYLPLILKLFAHQDIDRLIDTKTDRDDMSFFAFCNLNSKQAALKLEQADDSEEDDAAPPPIKLRRDDTVNQIEEQLPALSFQENQHPSGEVDELGYPTGEIPSEPITEFSWRNFFSSINFLRIMQKICKHKAHRNLLLVQYKSSNILKKALKLPQPELRLYTLKLFKNQVPYCGRKWRQGNMRVITSVYLFCQPELRDDWLAGSDVDAEVEEALPLEQALRSLTHWHNIRRYPDQMGADVKILEEESDFFIRELEKMEFVTEVGDESVMDGGWDVPINGW
ncbi:hypothetical protein B7463_g8937, partial [Scytalidium lignicola]